MTTPPYWNEATQALSKRDKTLKKIIASYKGEFMVSRGDAFFTLARSIAGQQISVKAADTIWGRTAALVGTVTPKNLLKANPEELRAAGLSQQKIRYLTGIAEWFAANEKRVKTWQKLEDEELIADLVALNGVGRWTAEMLLIFHFQRPDVFPIADLGLLKAINIHYNKGAKLPKPEALALSENWRPWRSVATWYLWRALDPVPVAY